LMLSTRRWQGHQTTSRSSWNSGSHDRGDMAMVKGGDGGL
jgi:hypothetical protein